MGGRYTDSGWKLFTAWSLIFARGLIKEREKADSFQKKFGGKIFSGYRSLLESEEIDAVYLPQFFSEFLLIGYDTGTYNFHEAQAHHLTLFSLNDKNRSISIHRYSGSLSGGMDG